MISCFRPFALAAGVVLANSFGASAQEVTTLRLHHFMPGPSTLNADFLAPWAEEVEAASDGRLRIELFPAMGLGGSTPDLIDQAIDGAVDIVLTLPGYTPGRFNRTEVFELPFIMEDSVATSQAFYDFVDSDLQDDEFADAKILAAWVHGPGVLHSEEPITALEDLAGREMRGPTRVVTDLLGELGATPVGMPLPAIPEALSRGTISGAVLPWEITPAIRLGELVQNHTELGEGRALYTATFIVAMNWDAYDALSDAQRAVLDALSGKALSARAAQVVADADVASRQVYQDNNIITLDAAEVARWIAASEPVYARWVERAASRGFDGEATIERAQALIAENTAPSAQ